MFTYRLSSTELAFCICFYLLAVRRGMAVSTALIPSVVLAVVAFFLGRRVITVATSVFGAYAVVNLLPRRPGRSKAELCFLAPGLREYYLALGLLALLGFLVQFGFGSNDPLVRFEKK